MIGLLSLLLVGLAVGPSPSLPTTAPTWDVVYCQPDVEEYLKKGSASFSLLFAMTLDEHGTPQRITAVERVGVNLAEAERCLRRWRLPGEEAGTEVKVEMRWTHGFGWEWIEIQSPRLHQRITMGENPCKYP